MRVEGKEMTESTIFRIFMQVSWIVLFHYEVNDTTFCYCPSSIRSVHSIPSFCSQNCEWLHTWTFEHRSRSMILNPNGRLELFSTQTKSGMVWMNLITYCIPKNEGKNNPHQHEENVRSFPPSLMAVSSSYSHPLSHLSVLSLIICSLSLSLSVRRVRPFQRKLNLQSRQLPFSTYLS